MAGGDNTTRGAAGLQLIALHGHHQPLPILDLNFEDMDTGNIEHDIGLGPRARQSYIWGVAPSGPSEVSCLVATDPEGPGALTP